MVETETSQNGPGGAVGLADPSLPSSRASAAGREVDAHRASQFRGRGEYSVDDKGRLTLPVQMRKPLRDGGNLVVLDGRAVIWDEPTYRNAVDELSRKVAEFELVANDLRTFLSLTHPISLDGQGRIVIPPAVRIEAGLERDVVVFGAGPRIELLPLGADVLDGSMSISDDVVSVLDAAQF